MKNCKIFLFLLIALMMTGLSACYIGPLSQDQTEEEVYQSPDTMPVLIAHGGGQAYGYRITNSLDAINMAYDNGFRYIEMDFEITSDNHIVLIHDWDTMGDRLLGEKGAMTLDEFKSCEKFEDLVLIDSTELEAWLTAHPDVRILTDVKTEENQGDNIKILTMLKDEFKDAGTYFIPQAYTYDEFEKIKMLGYDNVILTLYRLKLEKSKVLDFIDEHDLWALTMPQTYLSEGFLNDLSEKDVTVYTHGVNDLYIFEEWQEKGLYGIYTDYFIPSKWPYNK